MLGQANKGIREKGLQRALRRTMTDAERLLWQAIRGRQLAEYKFRRQHPYNDYILDFVCLKAKLVIEVDGGHHAEQAGKDTQRTARLEQAGFRVLRFWNHEVLEQLEAVKERIWLELQRGSESHPHPDPLPEGEGAANSLLGIVK